MWTDFVNAVTKLAASAQTGLYESFMRMIEIEQDVTHTKDPQNGLFSPVLSFGQIVKVKFVGQGAVLNKPHFAVIWHVEPKGDHVVVLPMTSKLKKNPFYNLGPIAGLRSPINVVKVNQPTTVSRKSIAIWTKKDFQTGNQVPIRLSSIQEVQLEDMFRISQMSEPSLRNVLKEQIGDCLPEQVEKALLRELDRPVTFVIEHELIHDKLWFKFHNEQKMRLIKLHRPGLGFGARNRLLKDLLSFNDQVRDDGEKRLALAVAATIADSSKTQAAPASQGK